MDNLQSPALDSPTVVGEIHIQLVRKGNQVQIGVVNTFDLLTGLGVLESAKEIIKQQAQPQTQVSPSPLVVARGNVPRA